MDYENIDKGNNDNNNDSDDNDDNNDNDNVNYTIDCKLLILL